MENSSKLAFYRSIKETMSWECYLSLRKYNHRKCVAKLRTSSHRLNVELARYESKTIKFIDMCEKLHTHSEALKNHNKRCRICCSGLTITQTILNIHLPFADPVIEDEVHVI